MQSLKLLSSLLYGRHIKGTLFNPVSSNDAGINKDHLPLSYLLLIDIKSVILLCINKTIINKFCSKDKNFKIKSEIYYYVLRMDDDDNNN